jgi:hypothetical protein
VRRRGARNEILAATAALSLACGGVISGADGGRDAHLDAVTTDEQDGDPFLLGDAASVDSGADTGVDVPWYPPPLPYGCPPTPLRRVV